MFGHNRKELFYKHRSSSELRRSCAVHGFFSTASTAACSHVVDLGTCLVRTLVSSVRSSSASSSVRPGGRGLATFPTAPSTGTSDRLSECSTPRPLLGEFRLISAEAGEARVKLITSVKALKARSGLLGSSRSLYLFHTETEARTRLVLPAGDIRQEEKVAISRARSLSAFWDSNLKPSSA